ncbi:MAG TPA: ABC transporter permease subunit, partial [Candidatus Acidoferrum sp.]|nr:ABC transporter permease subunit [Candidatus Acidoferrum sp.]
FLAWWVVFIIGFLYFFIPLLGTFVWSLQSAPLFSAYAVVTDDPLFASTLIYSFEIGVVTIIVSSALMVPTAYWVRLKLPRLRPYIEFITLLPFVIPPIILVFGLIRSYSSGILPLAGSDFGSNVLLVAAYVVLSFPYMYRSVDTGLRAIDVQSLTEAGQSLGAGWFTILIRVIFPNLRISLLSGAFLTLAIVIGEFTIATFLARPAFGPYIALIGGNQAYQPAAVSLISFGLTWIAMGLISIVGRRSRTRVTLAGAH